MNFDLRVSFVREKFCVQFCWKFIVFQPAIGILLKNNKHVTNLKKYLRTKFSNYVYMYIYTFFFFK